VTASWLELRRDITRRLARSPASNPSLEAIWITEDVSGHSGSEWLEIANTVPTARASTRVAEIVERRVLGEPLQYLLGNWQFGSLDLFVDSRVLIPRPETEQLVDWVLTQLEPVPQRGHAFTEPSWDAVDLGTGSGAIALAIASQRPDARVTAVERYADAAMVARANAAGLGSAARNVTVLEGDWYSALPTELQGNVRLLMSNPPYLSHAEWEALPEEVSGYEPREALVAGASGLEYLVQLAREAPEWLESGGLLALEHGDTQQEAILFELERTEAFVEITGHSDLAGKARFVTARRRAGRER
jgi:release factor glutamine methyltransferase